MRLILDSCVGLKTVLPEKDSPLALALMDDFRNQIHELIAPDCYLAECANAITRAERKGIIQPPDGEAKFKIILRTSPVLHPHLPLLPRAFELSSSKVHGFYDMLLIALAEQEGCQVVTSDEKLAQKFPSDVVLLSSL